MSDYRAQYEARAAKGDHVAARRLAAIAGLTDREVRAAEMEANYILNTAPGWRPSDALARAARLVREGAPLGSGIARGIMGE